MFTTVDKAIAAIIGAIVTILASYGIEVPWLTPELIGTIGSLLTGLLVWAVPNKPPSV